MKKLSIPVIAVLLIGMALCSYAAEMVGPDAPEITLLSAVTSTGAGAEKEFLRSATRLSCTATWGGTAPTSILLWVQLADASTVYDYATGDAVVTMSASPTRFYVVNKGGKYIRGNYVSKVGGDGTTSLTLKCTPY